MSQGNNGGPWGKPNGGNGPRKPNRSGKSGKSAQTHDIDELLKKGQERFKGVFGDGGSGGDDGVPPKRVFVIGALAVLLLWLGSGVYRVNSDELGVVLRFGEFHRTVTPGLAYHFPYPIERSYTPSVTAINKIEVGKTGSLLQVARKNASSRVAQSQENESMMLTSDRNIVDISFDVQWKIDATRPQDFLFNVRNAESLVKPVAESAMREVIGRNILEEENTTAEQSDLFKNQSQIALDTKNIMQTMLDNYQAGVEVISVNVSKPDVPQPVIDEFQDIKRAEQDKKTAENIAEGYRNEIIPTAKGQAEQMRQQAEAYKDRVVAEAEGDASRFLSVYNEYKLAKTVTRKRMYLETMESMMAGMPKILLDQKGTGAVPYLPLDTLRNNTKPQ